MKNKTLTDKEIERASVEGSLLQWIQEQVWEYMETPKLKRNGSSFANHIFEKVTKYERQRLIDEIERDVIGEDDVVRKVRDSKDHRLFKGGRNMLRAEQRKKLAEYKV